jgi:hypothetical protein
MMTGGVALGLFLLPWGHPRPCFTHDPMAPGGSPSSPLSRFPSMQKLRFFWMMVAMRSREEEETMEWRMRENVVWVFLYIVLRRVPITFRFNLMLGALDPQWHVAAREANRRAINSTSVKIKESLRFTCAIDNVGTPSAECWVRKLFSPQGWLEGYIELSGNGLKSYLSLSSCSNPAK